MTTIDAFGRITHDELAHFTDTFVPTCTDTLDCGCAICVEIRRGQRDGRKATDANREALMKTCNDTMPDGRLRYIADNYWTGVYDALLGN